MTLVKGPLIELFWTQGRSNKNAIHNGVDLNHSVKGAIMIVVGCLSWSGFMVLQVRIYTFDTKQTNKRTQ